MRKLYFVEKLEEILRDAKEFFYERETLELVSRIENIVLQEFNKSAFLRIPNLYESEIDKDVTLSVKLTTNKIRNIQFLFVVNGDITLLEAKNIIESGVTHITFKCSKEHYNEAKFTALGYGFEIKVID